MIRLAYYEHPHYVPLLKRAYELWEALEVESAQTLFHRTGGLYIGMRGKEFIEGAMASARDHGLAHQLLNHREIEKRYPAFVVPETHEGFFEEAAGFLVPEAVMSAHITGTLSHGAQLRGHVRAEGWETDSQGIVQVRTANETFCAKHLLITAGAWTKDCLTDLDLGLKVTRQTWGWFWPQEPDIFALGNSPCWFYESPHGGGHYGFPMMPNDPGFKLAWHHPSSIVTTPDTIERQALPEDEAKLRSFLQKHIPSAEGNLLAIRTCMYANSPDGHFIIDKHPKSDRVTFACGFSGHGFKFASVMGEILADLATEGSTDHPIGFLSLDRFR